MLSIKLYHTVRQKRTPKFPPSIRSLCSSSQWLSQNILFTCFIASPVFMQGTKMEEPIAMFSHLTSIITPSGDRSYVFNTFITRTRIELHYNHISGTQFQKSAFRYPHFLTSTLAFSKDFAFQMRVVNL